MTGETNTDLRPPTSDLSAESELPPGLTQAEVDQHFARVDASESASAKPFPGPMRAAFASGPRIVLGHTLQPVTMALISVLEQIDSKFIPMVDIIRELHDKPPAEMAAEIERRLQLTTREVVATAFCFITPIDDLEDTLEKSGKAYLSKQAMRTLGRKLDPARLGQLNAEIILHYIESFATALKYEAKSEGNFSAPPPEPKTASVGG